jgi:uncharacterized phage protein (TIGR02220 family)
MSSGRRYNCVATGFWRGQVRRSDQAKLLAAYLLTNDHTRPGGLYLLPLGYVGLDLGWTLARARAALDELIRAGAAVYDEDRELIFVTDWHRHDTLANPSAALAAARLVLAERREGADSLAVVAAAGALLPELRRVFSASRASQHRDALAALIPQIEDVSGHRVDTVSPPCVHGVDTPGRVGSGRVGSGGVGSGLFASTNEEESAPAGASRPAAEKGTAKDDPVPDAGAAIPYEQVIAHLNAATGRAFEASAKESRDLIRARWNEGRTLDDFKAVIDDRTRRWLDDPKMSDCLRPSTLFARKHFGEYLAAARANGKRPHSTDLPDANEVIAAMDREGRYV